MKPLLYMVHLLVIAPAILGRPLGLTFANRPGLADWDFQTLSQPIGFLILLGVIALTLVLVGCRWLEICVPGETRDRPEPRE